MCYRDSTRVFFKGRSSYILSGHGCATKEVGVVGRVGNSGTGEVQKNGCGWYGQVTCRQNIFRWSGMCRCMGSSTGGGQGARQETVRPICFGEYNIRNGRNGGIESIM